jgi:putative PIN family toxin of toxin-antitoxin system
MQRKPPRVVFDTNIVVSALVFGRRLAWLRGAWAGGRTVPLACRDTVAELHRVLHYPKFKLTPADRLSLLGDYVPYLEIVSLPAVLPLLPVACRDLDDTVFIHLAVAGGAEFLVSGDNDLASLRRDAPVEIRSASEFRTVLEM